MTAPVLRFVNSQDEKVEIDYNIAKQYFHVLSQSKKLHEMMNESPESEFSSDDSIDDSDEKEIENDTTENHHSHKNIANVENATKTTTTSSKQGDDNTDINKKDGNDNVNDINDNQDVEMTDLMFQKLTLEYIVKYALLPETEKKSSALKPPLQTSLENFLSKQEYDLLMEAFEKDIFLELYSAAIYLEFNELIQMCAAFFAEKISEIAAQSTDIMSNAKKVRKLLKMKNTWTEEEQKHLQQEMEYVQKHWTNN